MDELLQLGAWGWLILAVVLIVLKSVIPGIHFVWFGMAAMIVGIIALATGLDWQWQLLLFGILSFASAMLLRRYAIPQNAPSDRPGLNTRGSYYVGRVVVVEQAIENGRGRVRVGDTLWTAEGPDLAAGAKARIVSHNGSVLTVEPLASSGDEAAT